MELKIGDKAPSFILKDSELKDVELSTFSGQNVLILFFPLAFTSVCTEELCSTRDDLSVYNDMKTTVLAISVDSPFALAKFKEDNKLNFSVLSDFNKQVSKAYNAIYEDFFAGLKGVSKRAAFVVDSDGIIKYAEVLENAGKMPNFEEVRKTLKNLN